MRFTRATGALQVACTFCGATERRQCRTRYGGRPTMPHRQRVKAYETAAADLSVSFRLIGEDTDQRWGLDHFWGAHPCNAEVYEPRETSIIPESGAWAMIRRALPPIGGEGIEKEIRVGRIFWVEQVEGTDAEGFRPDGSYKIDCQSPWGHLCLWPYEYTVVKVPDLMDYWQAGEMTFHPLNIEAARLNDVTFYCRSRGIGLAEAAVMALGSLDEPVGWFEPRPDLASGMEALAARVNTSLAQHIRENPRSVAA